MQTGSVTFSGNQLRGNVRVMPTGPNITLEDIVDETEEDWLALFGTPKPHFPSGTRVWLATANDNTVQVGGIGVGVSLTDISSRVFRITDASQMTLYNFSGFPTSLRYTIEY